MVRLGAIDSPPKCPFILGFECAGEIEQVGEGVEGFKVSIPSMISQFLQPPSKRFVCTLYVVCLLHGCVRGKL